jgi:hypothetical protein
MVERGDIGPPYVTRQVHHTRLAKQPTIPRVLRTPRCLVSGIP